jgi:hypothetical protein
LFYDTLELMYEANSIEEMPPIVFDVFDKGFISRVLIPISEASYSEKDEVPKPKWYPCRVKHGGPVCGEVLASFSIVEDDFNFKTPLAYVNLMETV